VSTPVLIGETKMKHFIDWARTKNVAIINSNCEHEISIKKLLDFFRKGDHIFCESGFSHKLIYKILDKGCTVSLILAKEAHDLREEFNSPKESDMGDAKLLQSIYLQYPEKFILQQKPSDEELELISLVTRYRQINKDKTRFSNISQAIEWESGISQFQDIIKILDNMKREMNKKLSQSPLLKKSLKKLRKGSSIKGVGVIMLSILLATANPNRFVSQSKFLSYCKCKQSSRSSNKYDRLAVYAGVNMVDGAIKAIGKPLRNAGLKKEVDEEGKELPWSTTQIDEYIRIMEEQCLEPDGHILIMRKWYFGIKERLKQENPEIKKWFMSRHSHEQTQNLHNERNL